MASFNRSVFLAQFKEEAYDHIHRITTHLFHLEEHPDDQRAILEEIFRTAHTLKGSARMMGCPTISALAHTIEDLFVELRDHHLRMQPPIVDLVLYTLDTMTLLVDTLDQPAADLPDIAPITALFDAVLEGRAIDVPHVDAPRAAAPQKPRQAPQNTADHDGELPESPAAEAEDRDSIRIRTKDLDTMLNLVGEVLMNQYRYDGELRAFQTLAAGLLRQRRQITDTHEQVLRHGELDASSSPLLDAFTRLEGHSAHLLQTTKQLRKRFRADHQHMQIAVDKLQEHVVDIRMVPAARIFTNLPRLSRMTARSLGKQVDLRVLGDQTRLDTRLVEELRDPLIHLIQNAIRHGIESPQERERRGKPARGAITVSAAQEGSRILLRIKDDGAGIRLSRIQEVAVRKGIVSRDDARTLSEQDLYGFLFQSGFSTADTVDDIAGRGFGLDIVRDHIDRVQGEIEVRSQPGAGTEFSLKLPLTLTIMNSLLVTVADQMFAVPTSAVERTFEYAPDRLEYLGQSPTMAVDGVLLPIIDLRRILRTADRHPLYHAASDTAPHDAPPPHQIVMVLCSEEHRIGCIVDDLVEEREIVIKPLGPCLRRIRHVAGATTLRDETVIILFVRDVIHTADSLLSETQAHSMLLEAHANPDSLQPAAPDSAGPARILVIDDSLNTRDVERAMLERAGYQVETSCNGVDGLQKLRAMPFDAVMTDIEMPHMTGLQVLRAIRDDDRLQRLPVLVVSARSTEEARQQSLEAGANAHLVKGEFDERALLQALSACCPGKRAAHESSESDNLQPSSSGELA